MRADDQLPVLVEEMRRTFNLGRVSVLRRDTANDTWDEVAAAGPGGGYDGPAATVGSSTYPSTTQCCCVSKGSLSPRPRTGSSWRMQAHTVVILERSELTATSRSRS